MNDDVRATEIIAAQRSIISWYECEMERAQYDDEDVPDELAECERALEAAEKACEHEWISAVNKIISPGELCLKCGAIRA